MRTMFLLVHLELILNTMDNSNNEKNCKQNYGEDLKQIEQSKSWLAIHDCLLVRLIIYTSPMCQDLILTNNFLFDIPNHHDRSNLVRNKERVDFSTLSFVCQTGTISNFILVL